MGWKKAEKVLFREPSECFFLLFILDYRDSSGPLNLVLIRCSQRFQILHKIIISLYSSSSEPETINTTLWMLMLLTQQQQHNNNTITQQRPKYCGVFPATSLTAQSWLQDVLADLLLQIYDLGERWLWSHDPNLRTVRRQTLRLVFIDK